MHRLINLKQGNAPTGLKYKPFSPCPRYNLEILRCYFRYFRSISLNRKFLSESVHVLLTLTVRTSMFSTVGRRNRIKNQPQPKSRPKSARLWRQLAQRFPCGDHPDDIGTVGDEANLLAKLVPFDSRLLAHSRGKCRRSTRAQNSTASSWSAPKVSLRQEERGRAEIVEYMVLPRAGIKGLFWTSPVGDHTEYARTKNIPVDIFGRPFEICSTFSWLHKVEGNKYHKRHLRRWWRCRTELKP